MVQRSISPVANLPRFFLFCLTLLILASFSTPVSAAGISLFFDSEGRQLRSLPGSAERNTRGTARGSAPEGLSLPADVAYEFFPVSGRTFSGIMRSVRENGPYNKGRTARKPCRVAWNSTLSFQYDFSYAVDEESGKLHAAIGISDIAFEDRSTVTLPSLIDDTELNPVEQSMWRTYLAGLVEYCHHIVALIRDPQARKSVHDRLAETDYLIFDYAEGMDIEKSVESFLRGEAIRTGQEATRIISAQIADYEKRADIPGRENKQGTYRKTSGE